MSMQRRVGQRCLVRLASAKGPAGQPAARSRGFVHSAPLQNEQNNTEEPYRSPPLRERLRASAGSISLWTVVSTLTLHLYARRLEAKDAQEKARAKVLGLQELASAVRAGEIVPGGRVYIKSLESLDISAGKFLSSMSPETLDRSELDRYLALAKADSNPPRSPAIFAQDTAFGPRDNAPSVIQNGEDIEPITNHNESNFTIT